MCFTESKLWIHARNHKSVRLFGAEKVVENRRTLLLKEGVGGLNEFTLHRIIYIYINSCIKVFVYKQKRGILCGSPSYAAASCTSLVEYLARGLWGRLHLHNSTESLSLSPPSYVPLSRSLVWRHLCRKSYKDVTPAESRITFSFTFARDVNPRYSCENCAVIQKEKNRLGE